MLQAPNWLYFPEQWDPKSPWHDIRVRQAANLAIDREGMSKALFLGYCKVTNNAVVPHTFEYYWQPPAAVYDPAQAQEADGRGRARRRLRRRASVLRHARTANMAEVSVNNLAEIGIRAKLQPIERAGFFAGYGAKKYKRGIIQGATGAFGNAATRMEAFVVKGGAFAYGSYPDIDELFPKQAQELDRAKREAILAQDAADGPREGDLRADLAARLPQRRRPAGRRVRRSTASPASPTRRRSRTSRSRPKS